MVPLLAAAGIALAAAVGFGIVPDRWWTLLPACLLAGVGFALMSTGNE